MPRQVTSSRVAIGYEASRHVAMRHDPSRRITVAACYDAPPHVAARHDASRSVTGRDRSCAVFASWCLPGGTHGSPMHGKSRKSSTQWRSSPPRSSQVARRGKSRGVRRFRGPRGAIPARFWGEPGCACWVIRVWQARWGKSGIDVAVLARLASPSDRKCVFLKENDDSGTHW